MSCVIPAKSLRWNNSYMGDLFFFFSVLEVESSRPKCSQVEGLVMLIARAEEH